MHAGHLPRVHKVVAQMGPPAFVPEGDGASAGLLWPLRSPFTGDHGGPRR